MYDTKQSIDAQKKYCDEKQLPHFAPHTGRCWRCNQDIYRPVSWKYENGRAVQVPDDSPEKKFTSGITVDKASKGLVTGCPHCNRSYCD